MSRGTLLPAGTWTDVPGARCGVAVAGIASGPRDDVCVLVAGGPTASVTTTSTAAAAPCRWTRSRTPGEIRAVVVNAGNANAATGEQGERAVAETAAVAAGALGCTPDEILVCSTGVIGVPLPTDRLLPAVGAALETLGAAGDAAARAIMTTDTRPKQAAWRSADGAITVAGMAKGSGMIHPNMATMLGFLVTDAQVAAEDLQALLGRAVDRTFNAITVDGDTSTNDTVILQTTGLGVRARPGDDAWEALEAGVAAVSEHLARAIAADGEGATTLVEVDLRGLPDDAAARAAARAVVRSPLVKTAITGRDPNWGRVVGALGAAGVPDLGRHLDIDLAGFAVMRGGAPIADLDEAAVSAAMDAAEVRIAIRLPGPGRAKAWGCDLTDGYVRINADYRS